MYSIVLMAAATYGPATPGADMPVVAAPAPIVIGCGGCVGCVGYSCTGCVGYSCSGCTGCWGYSCTGCTGCCGGRIGFLGHRTGCHGGLFSRHSCHGCTGYSCTGYSCFGSCHGCTGYSCYGYSCTGCTGCTGCVGYSCHGCVGSYSYPVYVDPTPPMTTPAPGTDKKDTEKKTGANLKFQLPATATLFVDGQATSGTGSERSFFTPALIPGQKYYYDVRAEITVAGEKVTEQKRVIVSAGANVTESFEKLLAAASGTTTVAGK